MLHEAKETKPKLSSAQLSSAHYDRAHKSKTKLFNSSNYDSWDRSFRSAVSASGGRTREIKKGRELSPHCVLTDAKCKEKPGTRLFPKRRARVKARVENGSWMRDFSKKRNDLIGVIKYVRIESHLTITLPCIFAVSIRVFSFIVPSYAALLCFRNAEFVDFWTASVSSPSPLVASQTLRQ